MRILLVVGTLTGLGGIETCIRTLSQQTEQHGDSVDILALGPSLVDGTWHEGLRYKELAGPPSLSRQLIKGFPAILRTLKSSHFDVVMTIYSSTIPAIRLALALLGRSTPVVGWLHFSLALKQRTNLLKYAHGTLCISRGIYDAVRVLPGVKAETCFLVFNGTETVSVEPVARSQNGHVNICHIGRLMIGKQKRTDELLKALSYVTGPWMLHIVGDGEEVPQLKKLAAELAIDSRIAWHGWSRAPWSLLPQADVLVLCSAFEGFPMILLEALARGVPCISADCPTGPSDVIENGANGWLYPVEDAAMLTQLLQNVVDHPQSLPSVGEVKASAAGFDSAAVYGRMRLALDSICTGGKRA